MSRQFGRSPALYLASVALALAAGIAVAPAIAGGGITRFIKMHPAVIVATPVDYSGDFAAGVATLEGDNSGAGYGIVGTAASSAGIFGFSNTGTGLVGLSNSGFGLSGSSTNNIGINGFSQNATGVGGSGPNANYPNAGVFGTTGSTSTVTSPVGVYGQVPVTGFGVIGQCVDNTVGAPTNATGCDAVFGQTLGTQGVALAASGVNSTPGPGYEPDPTVSIQDLAAHAGPLLGAFTTQGEVAEILGTGEIVVLPPSSSNQPAFFAQNSGRGLGIYSEASKNAVASIEAINDATAGGSALLGESNGVGVEAFGFAAAASVTPALQIDTENGAPLIVASNAIGASQMSLDATGNMILAGALTQDGAPLIRTRSSVGRDVTTYAPQQSEPTVEDFGEGRLVDGAAYVRIDPMFASTMDKTAGYFVFLTPEGDNRGLYVAAKSQAGFEIRESEGGHSTIAFEYRIVAKPFGSTATRLPFAQMPLHADNTLVTAAEVIRAKHAPRLARRPALFDHPIGRPHAPIPAPTP